MSKVVLSAYPNCVELGGWWPTLARSADEGGRVEGRFPQDFWRIPPKGGVLSKTFPQNQVVHSSAKRWWSGGGRGGGQFRILKNPLESCERVLQKWISLKTHLLHKAGTIILLLVFWRYDCSIKFACRDVFDFHPKSNRLIISTCMTVRSWLQFVIQYTQ